MPVKEIIKRHEGFKSRVYKDSKGHPTVGTGFNLDEPSVAVLVPREVRLGKRELSPEENDKILDVLIDRAQRDAERVVTPKVWGRLSERQKEALTDMSYQHGYTNLMKYKHMREALSKGDYKRAAYEMRNSHWYNKYRNRAQEDINLFLEGVQNKGQSFAEAFSDARKKGLNIFVWRGKPYTTKLKEAGHDK